MTLSPVAKLIIAAAWAALQTVLVALHVPTIVITAIAAVLTQFGLLGQEVVSMDDLHKRAQDLHDHCSGVACAPELKTT